MKIPISTPDDRRYARERVRSILAADAESRPFRDWFDVYRASRGVVGVTATCIADAVADGYTPLISDLYAYRLARRFARFQGIAQPARRVVVVAA